jgi:hypothetical protein
VPGRTLRITDWRDTERTFEVEAGGPTDARLATFYYPYWVATANNKPLPTTPAADGSLVISLPEEKTTVNVSFREPLRTKAAGIISIISWTLVASLLIFSLLHIKRRDHESIRRDATN